MSQVSAQDFAVLCFWASKAGMAGEASTYAMPPGRSSGNYARHLNSLLGFDRFKKDGYLVKTVGQPRGGVERG
eukprot:14734880-Alexandrium_andersonii.AAC.1